MDFKNVSEHASLFDASASCIGTYISQTSALSVTWKFYVEERELERLGCAALRRQFASSMGSHSYKSQCLQDGYIPEVQKP